MTRHKIAILVGSLRKDSINRKIARSICAIERDRLDCSIVEIGDLPLYNQDYDGSPEEPASYARFRDAITAADGVLFVSPEYNRGLTAALKNALDVGSRPYGKSVWNRKPAAIVTASPGAIGGFGANHHPAVGGVPQHAGNATSRSLSWPRERRQFRARRLSSRRAAQGPGPAHRRGLRRLGHLDRAVEGADRGEVGAFVIARSGATRRSSDWFASLRLQ